MLAVVLECFAEGRIEFVAADVAAALLTSYPMWSKMALVLLRRLAGVVADVAIVTVVALLL